MKLIIVKHRGGRFVTNIPIDEVANAIENSHEYAKKIGGTWKDSVKFLQRRWIFEPVVECEVM